MVQRNSLTDRELLAEQGKEDIAGRDGQSTLVLCDIDPRESGQFGKSLLRKPQILPDLQNLGCSSFIFHGKVLVAHKNRTCQAQKSTMQERLAELKRRRKALGLKQENLAGWIGKERATYTRKEKGEFPLTVQEWDTIDAKLSELEQLQARPKEVVHSYSADTGRMREVREKIDLLYKQPDSSAVRTFERGLTWIVDMLEQETMMRDMLQKLNILLDDNQDFHKRISGMENDLNELKKLLKTESFDGKSGVGGL